MRMRSTPTTTMRRFVTSAVLAGLSALFVFLPLASANVERSLQVMNESGVRVDIHWVHPETGEMVLQSTPDVLHGASFALNSYVGHTFQVRELAAKRSKICSGEGSTCRFEHFTVNNNDDQIIFIREGVTVEHTDSKSVANKSAGVLINDCQDIAFMQVKNGGEPTQVLNGLSACVQKGIALEIERANEEIVFQASVRTKMAALLENYTCADMSLNTTEAMKTTSWRGKKVEVMIDRLASKIHTVEDFMTEEECHAVEAAAVPSLHDATVADGSGGSKLAESRKAKQAGIKVPWQKERDGDLIAQLSRRVYDYVNHVLPFDIQRNGQEDLMSIQYFGRGPAEMSPDRYMPHCDGDCTGLPFKTGNRMATMVMYCDIPEVGGATQFRNSGIHVKPKKYSATFFSYIDPKTMKMDNGFTEHSGCPVIEGEKKIVTQWVRLGVDDESPWSAFNTLGIKYSEAAMQ